MGISEISEWIYGKSLRLTKGKIYPERYGINQLVVFASNEVAAGARLVDAGGGSSSYRRYFSKVEYISMDFAKPGHGYDYSNLNIIGDLTSIPLKDNSVDAILCTQVLEHVSEPKEVLAEFSRVLKPGGQLFLSAPQGWPLHGEPDDFYRYTSYGLRHLLKVNGFQVVFIKPIGGFFWFMASILVPAARRGVKNSILKLPAVILFAIILPLLCFYLDRFDREKKMTVGYTCYCRK